MSMPPGNISKSEKAAERFPEKLKKTHNNFYTNLAKKIK